MTTQPKHDPLAPPLLIRIADAAQMLSLGRSTLYEMINRGELPSIKCGAARRIPVAALHRWVQDNTTYGA